jgi:hypothetical protein
MRPTNFAIAAALAVSLCAVHRVSAQAFGLPVNNSGVPTGLGLYADVAFPNGAAGDGTTFAASGRLGISRIGITATIASFNPSGPDNTLTSIGGSFNYKLLGGPLIPFSATFQSGLAYASSNGAGFWHLPIGVGFAITIPNPALAIKPWIAPRIDLTHAPSPAGWDSNFGFSTGVEFNLLSGLGFQASYDRVFVTGSDPGIFAVGAHYGLRIPGL